MAPPQGSAAYKKRNGILAISKDRKSVSWTPNEPPDSSPIMVISAANITNLQQTPESSPKVMLKIFTQAPGQTEPVAHVFNFTSAAEARNEANTIKEALANVIQAQKAAQNAAVAPGGGSSAAFSIANAISGGSRNGQVWEDDEKLKADVHLQQSLLREDPNLQKTFMEARSLKPDSITNTQFTTQFWASRVQLLRAHALNKAQNRGTYNVFSNLKREEGGTKMNLTAEHVHLIFAQYPVMRRVYDEVVPKRYDEMSFWSRFFQSMLYNKLRGLRVSKDKNSWDPVLDQYLDAPEITGLRPMVQEMHIPKTIDLEGNEENHSQRKGNRPDIELRPQTHEKTPIIRTLNALSEKLMAQVRPSDVDPSAPIGTDEATYDQLRLRDLAGDPGENRIILQIQDQSRFFSHAATDKGKDKQGSRNVEEEKERVAVGAIHDICNGMSTRFPRTGSGVINLSTDDSEAGGEDGVEEQVDAASAEATKHIMDLVRQHRAQTEEISPSSGLSPEIYERLTLTHATTNEFLKQFWSAFLSGDPRRAHELISLAESLVRSMDRINKVAEAAEAEREEVVKKTQRQVDERFKQTGKRHKIDYKSIGGGSVVVKQLLKPVINALAVATTKYQKALKEQIDEDGG